MIFIASAGFNAGILLEIPTVWAVLCLMVDKDISGVGFGELMIGELMVDDSWLAGSWLAGSLLAGSLLVGSLLVGSLLVGSLLVGSRVCDCFCNGRLSSRWSVGGVDRSFATFWTCVWIDDWHRRCAGRIAVCVLVVVTSFC